MCPLENSPERCSEVGEDKVLLQSTYARQRGFRRGHEMSASLTDVCLLLDGGLNGLDEHYDDTFYSSSHVGAKI